MVLIYMHVIKTGYNRRIEHRNYIEARPIAEALIESVCWKQTYSPEEYEFETCPSSKSQLCLPYLRVYSRLQTGTYRQPPKSSKQILRLGSI